MTHTLRTAILALALALTIGALSARAATDGRAVFRRTHAGGNISRIVILHGCADAEDSAATLRMVQRPRGYGNGLLTLTCSPEFR